MSCSAGEAWRRLPATNGRRQSGGKRADGPNEKRPPEGRALEYVVEEKAFRLASAACLSRSLQYCPDRRPKATPRLLQAFPSPCYRHRCVIAAAGTLTLIDMVSKL